MPKSLTSNNELKYSQNYRDYDDILDDDKSPTLNDDEPSDNETGYMRLPSDVEEEKKSEQNDLSKSKIEVFIEALHNITNVKQGHREKYGRPEQLIFLKNFFSKELTASVKSSKKYNFIKKYKEKLEKVDPTPAGIAGFLALQELEIFNPDNENYNDHNLVDFIKSEKLALKAFIEREEEKERQKENTCGARLRRWVLPITSVSILTFMVWPLNLLKDSLSYVSHLVSTDGDFQVVITNIVNKQAEQDVYMHKTLVDMILSVGLGFSASVFMVLWVYNYRFVVLPQKSDMQKIAHHFDQDRELFEAYDKALFSLPLDLIQPLAHKQKSTLNSKKNNHIIDPEAQKMSAILGFHSAVVATSKGLGTNSGSFTRSSSGSSSSSSSSSSNSSNSSSSSEQSHVINILGSIN